MVLGASDLECRAAAYHEAAHIVIAACLHIPISPNCIHIDNFANGQAWFKGATDGSAVSPAEVDRVVVALFAGGIAQRRIHANIGDACKGDDWRIDNLLEAHYADLEARQERRAQLLAYANELVTEHWGVITTVAEGLWSKSWQHKNQHHELPKIKTLSAIELEPLAAPIALHIDEEIE